MSYAALDEVDALEPGSAAGTKIHKKAASSQSRACMPPSLVFGTIFPLLQTRGTAYPWSAAKTRLQKRALY